MAQDYFDDELEKRKKQRLRKKKRKKRRKAFFTALGIILAAAAAFVITIKIAAPDFDLTALIGKKIQPAVSYVRSIGGTTTTSTTQTTTATTTTQAYFDYLDSSEFAFDSDKKGNFVGNLLNGGLVAKSPSYFYNISNGEGIYRFVSSTEDYALSYKCKDKLSSLNLVGDYLYFVNEDESALYKLKRGTSDAQKLADGVDFAYVYDKDIYYIGDNTLYYMSDSDHKAVQIYSGEGEITFVGISLQRVFFTESEDGLVRYLTVDKSGGDAVSFMEDGSDEEIKYPVMENGFLYYYEKKDNGKYNLMRRKFGSDKTVRLVKKTKPLCYPVTDANKIYYATLSDGVYKMREYNMNSKEKHTLISADGVESEEYIRFYHGGEYDFIIGKKSENGKEVYKAGSMYSSSENTMKFSNGKWKY